MSKELTDRQKEILEFITEHIEFNGFPPTYREIASHFNLASTFGVKRHLDALSKKGYINVESNSSRALSLTDLSLSKSESNKEEIIELPIVGRVAAGYPILAEENIEGKLSIQASLLNNRNESFGLKVKGDSMIEAGIFEGDVVIVNKQHDAKNGDIVIAMLQDEATLKKYERMGNIVKLIPENKNYDVIQVKNLEEFSIIGKVQGVFRWYN